MTSNARQNSPYRTDVSKVYNTTANVYTNATMRGDGGGSFTLTQATYEVLQAGPWANVHYTIIWNGTLGPSGDVELNFPDAPPPVSTTLGGPVCHLDHTTASMYAGIVLNNPVDSSGALQLRPNVINSSTGAIAGRLLTGNTSGAGIACGTVTYAVSYDNA